MRLNGQSSPGTGFTLLASFVLVTVILYFGKDVLIPIALASLLSFLLAPLVVRLTRWGLGKTASITLVVLLTFSVIGITGWLVMTQMLHLADQLPKYQENLHAKLQSLRRPNSQNPLAKASSMVTELRKDIESLAPNDGEKPASPAASTDRPLPVEVRKANATPVQVISEIVGPILKPLGVAGAVVFFVVLMLFQREDLRERFLTLVSRGELNVATQAVDDATQRVSRYLLMQLIVNATYGLPIGIGLYFIGVPNAFLWGLFATLLRFIPFLGPWIAATFPIVLAFAIDPGWAKLIWTVCLFVVVEVISNNIVEPWLYGASTGISNIALLMAAFFWTWLWGTPGLLLSTPLTVCLLVLGKYVPGLSFLSVLLGSEPVLEPSARFYQRMLAMDEDELIGLSEKYVQDKSLVELYDGMMVPALGLAEQDRHKGALAESRQSFILQNTRDIIDTFDSESDGATAEVSQSASHANVQVLCLAAKDDADEIAALMLAQLLKKNGISAHVLGVKTLPKERSNYIRRHRIGAVCLSALPPFAVTPARVVCRRVKQEFPQLPVLIGIWNSKAAPTEIAQRLGSACQDGLVHRLSDAVARLQAILAEAASPMASQPSAPTVNGSRRPPSPPVEPEPEEIFDWVTREAAKTVNIPVSLVSLIDTDPEFWKLHGGLPPGLATGDGIRDSSVCGTGAAAEEILDVPDVSTDSRFASDPLLQARGIRFYAGVPLRTTDGHLVGTLCLTDTEPHQISDRDRDRLKALGDRLMKEVERRDFQPQEKESSVE